MSNNSLIFPKEQKEIGDILIKEIDSITFEEPSLIKVIPKNAFTKCIFAKNYFTFPESLISIEYGAFMQCNLSKISLGKNVESIGIHSFSYNTKLEDVDLFATKIVKLNQCFRGCVTMQELRLPNNIECIESKSFESCRSLQKVDLPHSLKKIGASAFQNCSKLEKIIIPSQVEEIGTYAFAGCHKLKEIFFDNITNIRLSSSSFKDLDITLYVPFSSSDNDIDKIYNVFENIKIKKFKKDENKIDSLEEIKPELYNICEDIDCLKDVNEKLIQWNKNGINLENGIVEVKEQHIEWCEKFEYFIKHIKLIVVNLINIDDNIKSNYENCREELDKLNIKSKKEQVDLLCDVYNKVVSNLNEDIKLLSEAYKTLGNYSDIGIELGNGLNSIKNQVEKIELNILESNKKISEIYYECDVFSKILLKFNENKN